MAGGFGCYLDRQPQFWEASADASIALGFELAVAQTILLLQLVFGLEPDAAAARILKRQPQAYALAEFCVGRMEAGEACAEWPVREMWAYRDYLAAFEARYTQSERFAYRLSLWLFQDSVLLCRHPTFLLGMPLARIMILLKRHGLTRE